MGINRSLALLLLLGCGQTASVSSYFTAASTIDPTIARGSLTPRIASSMHAMYLSQTARAEPAVSLRPTDGSELVLESVNATVTIDGPVARTELHFTFHNPEQRVREGKFSIALPSDAAVGRLAMKVHGVMREARIVSREQGRKVFETLLQRGIDPALLEQDHGNTFSARVFPIFADEHKEIVISYDQRVDGMQPYTLPVAGLVPSLASSAIVVENGKRREIPLSSGGAAIDELVLAGGTGNQAIAYSDAFVARIELPGGTAAAPFDRTMILVDTSASRAEIMTKQAELLRALLDKLPTDSHVIVGAYDGDVTELYRGAAGAAGHAAQALLDHGALGGSNLGVALTRAAASGATRLVLVGDGTPTFGETEPAKLASLAHGLTRIDAVQVGASIDRTTLAAIVRAGRNAGAIVDARDRDRAMHQLAIAVPREVPIRVPGAVASWPATTRDLAPGEPVWVFGRTKQTGPLAIQLGDRTVTVTPRTSDAPVGRMVARAEITALTEKMNAAKPAERPAIATEIEKLALANFLVSSQTSLIVLESDYDEQRFLGSAPTIDPTSTTQGITIDKNYIKNIPVPGRTFEAVLGAAAGSQSDGIGVSFSGSTSLENQYYVDGIDTTGLMYGETISIAAYNSRCVAAVCADITTPFVQDLIAEQLNRRPLTFRALPEPTPSYEYKPTYSPPYEGNLQHIVETRAAGQRDRALELASEWQLENPGDVAAILALGESLEARGSSAMAARAYASLVDLYPGRAELVRVAAERLDRVGGALPAARGLAIDAYRRALRDRPDHATGYRLLAWSLVRAGQLDEAFEVLGAGLAKQTLPNATYIFARDMGLVGAAIVARDPSKRAPITARMRYGLPDKPSMQVVLSWETDANDVDLLVVDRHGGGASPKSMTVPGSGGEAIDDVRTGYGPELFRVEEPTGYPYKLAAHYSRKGPMGLGLGTVQVVHHDGKGKLVVEDRPFVIQNDNAMIELGTVTRPW